MATRPWERLLPLAALAAPVAVAGSLVAIRSHIDNADGAMILMSVVAVVAISGRRMVTALSALSSALSFDFFLTRPYYSLRITRATDLVTEVLLIVVGLLVGDIAARGRSQKALARSREGQLRLVHEYAERIADGEDPDVVLAAVANELCDLLSLRACHYTTAPERPGPRIEPDGRVSVGQVWWDTHLPGRRVELPVRAGGQRIGAFVLTPTPAAAVSRDRRIVAVALADQLGAALAARSAQRAWPRRSAPA